MTKPVLRVIHGIRQRALSARDAAALKAGVEVLARDMPGARALLPSLFSEIDRETTQNDRWDFVMLNVHQNAHALRLIRTEAKRPMLSLALWEVMTSNAHRDTGAVALSREDLAARVGKPVNHVSGALAEMVRWNVLLRVQVGRMATWLVNPNIATRLPGAAGEAARKAAGPLRLVGGTDAARIEDARQEDMPL